MKRYLACAWAVKPVRQRTLKWNRKLKWNKCVFRWNWTAEYEWERCNGLHEQRTIVGNRELDSLRIVQPRICLMAEYLQPSETNLWIKVFHSMKLTQQNFKLNKSASIQREKEVIWKSVYFTLNENNKKWLKTVDKCKTKFETNFQNHLFYWWKKVSAAKRISKNKTINSTRKKNPFFSSIEISGIGQQSGSKMWLTNRQFYKMDIWIKLFVCAILLCGLITGTEGEC